MGVARQRHAVKVKVHCVIFWERESIRRRRKKQRIKETETQTAVT
jgi:hypothetical protein